MSDKRSGADVLVACLIQHGVEVVFGYPGDTSVGFYDALFRNQDRIRHVLARDERSAAIMADVYARVSGRIGVVEASSGGGATFLVGGLGESYAASIPMLVITSDVAQKSQGTGAITEIDQVKLFSAVTKWQGVARQAEDIPDLVGRAFQALHEGRPAPVSLVVPTDVFEKVTTVSIKACQPVKRVRPGAGELAQRAADFLQKAKHPAILAGSGVHLSGAWKELQMLAELASIPVATTIHGKGAFPERHPLSLGVSGGNGARDYANEYLMQADVVLLVGTRANSTDTNGYTAPRRDATAIHIDLDPERAGKNFSQGFVLLGDARTVLSEIKSAYVVRFETPRQGVRLWIAERRKAWQQGLAEMSRSVPRGIHPYDIVMTIQRVVDGSTVILGEPGTPTPYLAAYWEGTQAGRQVIIPRGHGVMGYALSGSIGASLARPHRSVVAITTDGSFGMSAGELETAVRLDLPVIFVHLRNETCGWIKMLQHLYLEHRYFGVDFSPVDAAMVARGFGLSATTVTNLGGFEEAVGEAWNNPHPSFIDVPVPVEYDVVPPVAPWVASMAGVATRPSY